MSAGTLSQLFQIESVFEAAFKLILQEAGIETVYIARETAVFETPSVAVKVVNGAVNIRHSKRRTAGVRPIYDCWDSRLEVEIKTNRGTDGQDHSLLCGKVRAALTYDALSASSIGDTASFLALTDIREEQGATEFDTETNIDTTSIPFYLLVSIRESAWPA